MSIGRVTPLKGLSAGLTGLGATVGMAGSGLRHVGWWLAWQTRPHPGDGCRPVDERVA